MTQGEGWHNYHHVFPWDYKTAELGNYRYNITTAFIDFFAKIGKKKHSEMNHFFLLCSTMIIKIKIFWFF